MSQKWPIVFLLIVFCNAKVSEKIEAPEVSIPLGRIEGSMLKTRLGKDIYAFRGLRYGEAPTGNMRFKPAVPAKAWDDVFDASKEGPACFGKGKKSPSHDDCLRLNVYTTKLGEKGGEKYPVMVFIHPGGFYTYSGQSKFFGPEYLLDEDLVLVTINYRLGTIGFSATGDEVAPGNLGLKDQVEALRWVQSNIAPFNGDPSCVTIVGYSAGAWSTALHMLSPMSQGLFHRAVSMSGSPIQPDGLPYDQVSLAKKQAKLLGCPTNSTGEMIECFEQVPIEKMAQSRMKFFESNIHPHRYWTPVVEPNLPGVDRFLVDQPVDIIRKGEFTKVPFLAGTTLHEFAFKVIPAVESAKSGNHSTFNEFDRYWEHIAPIVFMYENNASLSAQRSEDLRTLYFGDESISLRNWKNLSMMYADVLTTLPVRRLVDLISEYSDQPVYYYRFVYRGRHSYRNWKKTNKPFGVSHDDDLQYLFFMKDFFPKLSSKAPESLTIEHMTAMWASFAKTGDPIPKDNPLLQGIIWRPYDKKEKAFMDINNTLTLKTAKDTFNVEKMKALERIFPLSPVEGKDDNGAGGKDEEEDKEKDKKDDEDDKPKEGDEDKPKDEDTKDDDKPKEEDTKDDDDKPKEGDTKDDEDKPKEEDKKEDDDKPKEDDKKDEDNKSKEEEDKKEGEDKEKKEDEEKKEDDKKDEEKKDDEKKEDEKKDEDKKDDEKKDEEKKEDEKKEDEKKEDEKKEDEKKDEDKKDEEKKEDEKKDEEKKDDEKKEDEKKEDEKKDEDKKDDEKKEDEKKDEEKKDDEKKDDEKKDEEKKEDEKKEDEKKDEDKKDDEKKEDEKKDEEKKDDEKKDDEKKDEEKKEDEKKDEDKKDDEKKEDEKKEDEKKDEDKKDEEKKEDEKKDEEKKDDEKKEDEKKEDEKKDEDKKDDEKKEDEKKDEK